MKEECMRLLLFRPATPTVERLTHIYSTAQRGEWNWMRAATASSSGEASDRLSASFDLCRQTFALSLATKKDEEEKKKK